MMNIDVIQSGYIMIEFFNYVIVKNLKISFCTYVISTAGGLDTISCSQHRICHVNESYFRLPGF